MENIDLRGSSRAQGSSVARFSGRGGTRLAQRDLIYFKATRAQGDLQHAIAEETLSPKKLWRAAALRVLQLPLFLMSSITHHVQCNTWLFST